MLKYLIFKINSIVYKVRSRINIVINVLEFNFLIFMVLYFYDFNIVFKVILDLYNEILF